MAVFDHIPFGMCNINDSFFESLKDDYPDFEKWFKKKSEAGEHAFVYTDNGIQAFLYIKDEEFEEVCHVLPKAKRMKIGTLKISEGSQGQRLGEGAIGIALWKWQQSEVNEIYVTVFEKHQKLISILESFGFINVGKCPNDECVFVKDKRKLKYETAKLSFPYLNPDFTRGKYIPINDEFHDKLFQYSELKGVERSADDATAASNGLSKVFIATPSSDIDYAQGDIAIIYRIHTGDSQKTYKSAATSFCTIVKQTVIRKNNHNLISLGGFLEIVGNKSVYTTENLNEVYNSEHSNLIVIEMLYNGYFGAGHNVIHKELKAEGLFESYPYVIDLSKDEVVKILGMGGVNVQNIIINKSRAC
jgi:hypothetical protein